MQALNPAMRIGKQFVEVPMIPRGISIQVKRKTARLAVSYGCEKLPDPARIMARLSAPVVGRQQQRIVIAWR